MKSFKLPRFSFRFAFLSLICGILAGLSSTLFLITLDWATNARNQNPLIIWALPLAGFFIGWVYHQYGKDVAAGNNLILEEIHNPQKVLPLRMAPFVLMGTILTHLFGGSAGREGTAVQMGASLSDQAARFFRILPEERKIFLAAGAGAGFGAAIGAPWAGALFGLEVIHVGNVRSFAVLECLIASFVGYFVTIWLSAPHSVYPTIPIPALDSKTLLWVAAAGIIFGLAARFFSISTHIVERIMGRLISHPPLKPFWGGVLLVFFFYLEGSYQFVGLGIDSIQKALLTEANWTEPALKSLFTSLTIGTGFKGGEFIPLVFIGTTLGSALSAVIPVSVSLLAAVGFAAVFAGAANTPIACTIMAMELFGPQIGAYAAVACLMSFCFSGRKGIYKSQK